MPDENTTTQVPAPTVPPPAPVTINIQPQPLPPQTPQAAVAGLVNALTGVVNGVTGAVGNAFRTHPVMSTLGAAAVTHGEQVVDLAAAGVELIDAASPQIVAAAHGAATRVADGAVWVKAYVAPYWNNRVQYYRQARSFLIRWFVYLFLIGLLGDIFRNVFQGMPREGLLYACRAFAFGYGVWGLIRVIPTLSVVRAAIYAVLTGMAGAHTFILGDAARAYARRMGVVNAAGELQEDKADAAVSQVSWHLVIFFILMPALLIASPSLILFSGMIAIISLLGVILGICLARGWAVLGGYVWALRVLYTLIISAAIMTVGNMIQPGFFGPMIASVHRAVGYFQAFWTHGPVDYVVETVTGVWVLEGASDVFIDNTLMDKPDMVLTVSQQITGVLMTLGIITTIIFVIFKLRRPVLGMLPYNADAVQKIQDVWAQKAVMDARREAGLPVLPEHQTTPATPVVAASETTTATTATASAVATPSRWKRDEWILVGMMMVIGTIVLGGLIYNGISHTASATTTPTSTVVVNTTTTPTVAPTSTPVTKPTKTVANAKPTRTVTVSRTPASPATTDCSTLSGVDARKTCEDMNRIIRGN